jgi:hypothetical protein
MNTNERRIGEPEVNRDAQGIITEVRIHFGPHHFFQVRRDGDRVKCAIGTTHHGVEADASDVPSEFERLVNELQRAHPKISF